MRCHLQLPLHSADIAPSRPYPALGAQPLRFGKRGDVVRQRIANQCPPLSDSSAPSVHNLENSSRLQRESRRLCAAGRTAPADCHIVRRCIQGTQDATRSLQMSFLYNRRNRRSSSGQSVHAPYAISVEHIPDRTQMVESPPEQPIALSSTPDGTDFLTAAQAQNILKLLLRMLACHQ